MTLVVHSRFKAGERVRWHGEAGTASDFMIDPAPEGFMVRVRVEFDRGSRFDMPRWLPEGELERIGEGDD